MTVHQRAASRLAVSAAHLRRFPPSDALFVRRDVPRPPFSPESWALLQPPPPAALAAFAHRVGLPAVLADHSRLQHACTHPSFLALFRQASPNAPLPPTNALLAPLGNSLLGLFAAEYVHAAYPYLPTRVLKAAVTAYVGPLTCASVAQEMGAAPLLRWHRTVSSFLVCFFFLHLLTLPPLQPPSPTRPAVLHTDALASIPRALAALVYQERSILSARQFVHSYFLSREIDLRRMIKFTNPKKALLEMVKKFQRESPKSR